MLLVGMAMVGFTASSVSAWGPISHNAIAKSADAPYPASSWWYKGTYEGCASGPDVFFVPAARMDDVGSKVHGQEYGHMMYMVANNKNNQNSIACSLGWITHIAGDPYMHNYVNGLGYLRYKYGRNYPGTTVEATTELGIDSLTYFEKGGRANVVVDAGLVAETYNKVRDSGKPGISSWSVAWRAGIFAGIVQAEQRSLPAVYPGAKLTYSDYTGHYTSAYRAATSAMNNPIGFNAPNNG